VREPPRRAGGEVGVAVGLRREGDSRIYGAAERREATPNITGESVWLRRKKLRWAEESGAADRRGGSWVPGPGSWVLGPGSWIRGPGSGMLGAVHGPEPG
jgi:hypothetical protein